MERMDRKRNFFIRNLNVFENFAIQFHISNMTKYSMSTVINSKANMIASVGFLPEVIKQLEEDGKTVLQAIQIVESVRERLPNDILKARFDEINNTNPGYDFFKNFSAIRIQYRNLLYTPLTSADVERSFSCVKNILTDRRNLSIKSLN